MKKIITVLIGMVCMSGFSQDDLVISGISNTLESAQGSILALAEAFTEDQLKWAPEEGVRTAGQAIMHTAAANYYFAMKMGFPPPEGVDMMNMEAIEGKQNIIDAFKQSSEFIMEKLKEVDSGSFGEEVDLGFAKMNKVSSMLLILEHNAEHKGQLIAYARSNGVTPPWSQSAE